MFKVSSISQWNINTWLNLSQLKVGPLLFLSQMKKCCLWTYKEDWINFTLSFLLSNLSQLSFISLWVFTPQLNSTQFNFEFLTPLISTQLLYFKEWLSLFTLHLSVHVFLCWLSTNGNLTTQELFYLFITFFPFGSFQNTSISPLMARLHIPFMHAFSELRCVFLVLTLIQPTKVITRKIQRKVVTSHTLNTFGPRYLLS